MPDLINEPDATRLIFGLRDTGYDVHTACADIIDNSIAAKASTINVEIALLQDGRKFVYFGDDGEGMDEDGVRRAMRYGAPERENPESLGKFGLGLKTASSSVCKRFTLISRKSRNQRLAKLTWDLDHVAGRRAWEMLAENVTQAEKEKFEELCGTTGTLLVWEKCDRILAREYEPGSVNERNAIRRLTESLSKHFSLVFHRFLDKSDTRARDVEIYVNQDAVEPWNPFYPAKSEQVMPERQQKVVIELQDGSTQVAHIKAWILPHSRDMSKEEADKFARITNRAQGFYVYREGRLIQDGGWLGVFGAAEPHYSLLRIEFDFNYKLDDAFKIDVKKSRILLDPNLEDYLKKLLAPIYREAGLRYRRKNRQELNSQEIDHTSANKNIDKTPNVDKPKVSNVDLGAQSAVISNNQGAQIRIKQPIQDHVNPATKHVEAVDTITTGELWQPALRSQTNTGHQPSVLLNKHHDFYQKIYRRASASGYAIEGMDLLFWAFAVAEMNNTDDELAPMFEDIREEVSANLRKLLRNLPDPDERELNNDED